MKTYMKELKTYIQNNKESNVPESILQFLVSAYLEEYPVTGEQVKMLENKLSPVFECIPLDMSNDLFQTVYTLCWEYGRAGFCAGLRTGLRLRDEIEDC